MKKVKTKGNLIMSVSFITKRPVVDQKLFHSLKERLPDYKKMLQEPELTALLDEIKSKITVCNDPNILIVLRKQEGHYERALKNLSKSEILKEPVIPSFLKLDRKV